MMYCSTDGCNNIPLPKKGRFCQVCLNRRYRNKNKLKYAYSTLKNNAKRRGKDFDLSFEDFCKFAKEIEYIKRKGVKGTSIHIDRIDGSKGYTLNNIQALTNSENVKKYLKYVYDEKDRKMLFWNNTAKNNINKKGDDCPF